MILHLLDVPPLDDSFYLRNMTPKERKKHEKEMRKAEKKRKKEYKKMLKARRKAEKKHAKQEPSQVIAPFNSYKTGEMVNLKTAVNNVKTSSRDISSEGMKYEASASSLLLSSILIVGAAIFICISGALAYRKNTEHTDN